MKPLFVLRQERRVFKLAIALLSLCIVTLVPAQAATESDALEVMTDSGAVRGFYKDDIRQFLGIPFAAPPVGELRWADPQAPTPWSEVFNATSFGKRCAQGDDLGSFAAPSTDEDCLYLNVFTPAGTDAATSDLPVMVWLYGGGLWVGESDDYDAQKLVKDGDVIIVTINYRLGIFGFFAHPSLYKNGQTLVNYGIRDQQFALEWVQNNIESFGGNPDNVTIFGESAGGRSVMAHMASPLSKGLFHKGILESGTSGVVNPITTLETAEERGASLAALFGCSEKIAACLRALTPEQLLATERSYDTGLAIDNVVIPDQLADVFGSGEFNHVPVINGANRDEYTWFVAFAGELAGAQPITAEQYPIRLAALFGEESVQKVLEHYPLENYDSPSAALAAAQGDSGMICSVRKFNQLVEPFGDVYAYEFADRTSPPAYEPVSFPYGAAHTQEIQYLFPLYHGASGPSTPLNKAQEKLSDEMVAYWTTFAANGNPNSDGLPNWPSYTPDEEDYMVLDIPEPSVSNEFADAHNCTFWQEIWDQR